MQRILLILCLVLTSQGYAAQDCGKTTNSFEASQCLSKEVKILKNELNVIYKKLYTQTEAKTELDMAQKAWLNYREQQCGSFIAVYTAYSPAAGIMDLDCQATLLKQRIDYLKTLLE